MNMAEQSEAKDVRLTINASKDEYTGLITLNLYYTGTKELANTASVNPGSTVTWIAGDNVKSIERIYKDSPKQQNNFSTQPAAVDDNNTEWTGIVSEDAETDQTEAYTINIIDVNGNRIWQDPNMDVDPRG